MTESKKQLSYGLWDSPFTPEGLALSGALNDIAWGGDGSLIWLERQADRNALVMQPADGQAPRNLSNSFSARGKIGYGGGEFTVGDGVAVFVDAKSGRLYRQTLEAGPPVPITPAFGGAGAPSLSPDGRWLAFVHTLEGEDVLAVADAQGKFWPQKLAWGDDFYMQPAWHPSGEQLAWVAWSFPNMPWDGTLLRLGKLVFDGNLPRVTDVETLAGGDEIAIFQPQFSPDGNFLAYVADESGWGELHLYDLHQRTTRQLTFAEAEHGAPAWTQGRRTYGFSPDGNRLFFLRSKNGAVSLWQLEIASGQEQPIPLDAAYTYLGQLSVSPTLPARLALLASGPSVPARLIVVEPDGRPGAARIIRRSSSEEIPAKDYSLPQAIEWQAEDGGIVHGIFYPPHNPRFTSSGKPPVIVHIHGGPTGQTDLSYASQAQFFATRGYAYLEVNFRGSAGYGRAYQNALRGEWGELDVRDTVSGLKYVSAQGWVDAGRAVIFGGSSGGMTVLRALEDFPGLFKAGIALYPVTDLFAIVIETHKFEARYPDRLIGPLPEAADLYRRRSPSTHLQKIRDPLALFLGAEDPVVPPAQAEVMAAVLRSQGTPLVFHVYPGEGHGFRQPENIAHFYRSVEDFLRRYVLFA